MQRHFCPPKFLKLKSDMKKNLLIAFVTASVIFTSCGETKTETPAPAAPLTALQGDAKLSVDATASKVIWSGNMTGTKSYSHSGTINLTSGNIELKEGKVVGGTLTIDMNSINPTDANYTAEQGHTTADLIGHLSSPDFFDIANNPTASFAVTAANGNSISGNLTIRGKSNPETVEVSSIALEGDNVRLKGKLTFDRQKYSVAFAMPVKDLILADDISLEFDILAKK